MIEFTILGRLPGLNEIVNVARYNRYAGASQKKKATELCMFWINAAKVPVFTHPIAIHLRWIEPNNRRDIDNVAAGAKFVLDALVALGKLPGDGRKHVKRLSHDFPPPDAQKPRICVEIDTV